MGDLPSTPESTDEPVHITNAPTVHGTVGDHAFGVAIGTNITQILTQITQNPPPKPPLWVNVPSLPFVPQ